MPGSEEEDGLAGCGFSISVLCVAALGTLLRVFLCVCVCVCVSSTLCCLPSLSAQTLQSHWEYLKEQICAYQGKAKKIARGTFWLDHMLVNTIHGCTVL